MTERPLPEPALALLAEAFPGEPIGEPAPTHGGFSHHSALIAIGGRHCFVKAASLAAKRASLRHEADLLGRLAGRGLATPQLLALADGGGWTVEVLAELPGASGLLLYGEPPALAAAALAGLAGLLAATHTLALPAALRASLQQSLEQPIWQPASVQLTHGDAGLHNLLWGPHGYALVDWEWAGWGDPLLDLAWVWWTLRWRSAPPERWAGFLSSYRAARPIGEPAPAALRALALGQIAGILARVREQPAAYAEWVRRAEWTLGLAPG